MYRDYDGWTLFSKVGLIIEPVSDMYRHYTDSKKLPYPYDIEGKEVKFYYYRRKYDDKIKGIVTSKRLEEIANSYETWREYDNVEEMVDDWNESIINEKKGKYLNKLDTAFAIMFPLTLTISVFLKIFLDTSMIYYTGIIMSIIFAIMFIMDNFFDYDVAKDIAYEYVQVRMITDIRKYMHKTIGKGGILYYGQYEGISESLIEMKRKIKKVFFGIDEEDETILSIIKNSRKEPIYDYKMKEDKYEQFNREKEEIKSIKLKNKFNQVNEELIRIRKYKGSEEYIQEYSNKLLQVIKIAKNTLNQAVMNKSIEVLDNYLIILSNYADDLLYNEDNHLSEIAELEFLKKESEVSIQHIKMNKNN